MKKEWVILAVLIVGVAALEVFGGESEPPHDGGSPETVTRADTGTQSDGTMPESATDAGGAFRTVTLHVTGMT